MLLHDDAKLVKDRNASSLPTDSWASQLFEGLEVVPVHQGLEATPSERLNTAEGPPQKQLISGQNEEQYLQPCSIPPPVNAKELDSHPDAWVDGGKEAGAYRDSGRRRKIWTALCIVILFAATIGGFLGGLFGAGILGNSNGDSIDDPKIAVHRDSRLAASNWTDSAGINHRIVYFQDEHSHLVAQHWNSSGSGEWSTINITASVGISENTPLPMAGTSLTSVASNWLTSTSNYVFYQDDNGSIYQVGTTSSAAEAGSWAEVSFGDVRPRAAYRSAMAATFQGCGSGLQCPGCYLLFFVDTANGISYGNSTEYLSSKWTWDQRENPGDVAGLITPLAAFPMRFRRPESVDYLFQTRDNDMAFVGNYNYTVWAKRTYLMSLESIATRGITAQLAGIRFNAGVADIMLALQSDGSVQSFWWTDAYGGWNDEDYWIRTPEVQFTGYSENQAPKWTSMATSTGGWFYGLRNGQILEFKNRQVAGKEDMFEFQGVTY